MSEPIDKIVLDPPARVNAAIIWLHGLGADGNDFVPIVPELQLPDDHGVRFIFPHAPSRPITINGGMEMPGWYDIIDPHLGRGQDLAGIRQSADTVEELINEQIDAGIPGERIILAGFSQGGAIAYYLGLRTQTELAGIIALSTYIPAAESLQNELNAQTKKSIFIGHGTHDPLVPESLGREAEATLKSLGIDASYHNYQMEHAVCLEEIRDIAAFIKRRLGY
jgi:phospholipase/carboxylesterase